MEIIPKSQDVEEYLKGDVLTTERLILRRWEDSDAEDLYKYA